MRTQAAFNLTKVGLSVLMLTAMLNPALALNCTVKEGVCFDTKTKKYRNCTTRVCLDNKGNVVSTETTIEKQAGDGGKKPTRRSLPEASGAGAAKKQ